MMKIFPADILLPDFSAVDGKLWACVACDQYTSQPDYWEAADALVGDAPSTLRLILPEVYLAETEARKPAVLAAMDTGLFTYVAHPDIMHFTGDSALYERQMRRICVAAREKQIPLEINLLGIRDNRHYPREEFWRFAGEEGSPVTFGFDAHDPQSAYDEASIPVAMQMVRDYHLNYIGKPTLIPLNK